jgi:glycosyltransferase involved in cell wall biosynthesis
MKFVFVNRYFAPDMSATSQLLYDLASHLAAYEHEVHVVSSSQLYDDPGARLQAHEMIAGVAVHRVATTRFGRDGLWGRAIDYLTFFAAATWKMSRLVRQGDVLIAKTDPPMISVVAALVANWRGAKLVNWVQDLFPEVAIALSTRRPPRWLERVLFAGRNWSLRAARTNVLVGQRMKERILACGIDPAQIQVIQNWAHRASPSPIPVSASKLRAMLKLEDKFVVGYSGNLGRAHDIETLLRAAIELRNDPEVTFLLIGGGVGMRELRHSATAHGLQNMVFLPYQPRSELPDSLSAADVHLVSLLPILEGLIVPSKFYGILAVGRPVVFIGAADGELARIISDGKCGATVAIGDHDALVARLLSLKSNATERLSIGVQAERVFRSRHTDDVALLDWQRVLSAAAASWPSR